MKILIFYVKIVQLKLSFPHLHHRLLEGAIGSEDMKGVEGVEAGGRLQKTWAFLGHICDFSMTFSRTFLGHKQTIPKCTFPFVK